MWKSADLCHVFASFTLAFALQLRKKHGKTSVRVRKTSEYKKNLIQSTDTVDWLVWCGLD